MAHVFKRGKYYSGRHKVLDDSKWHQVSLHTTDKQVAQSKLREILKEKEQEAVGHIAPALIRQSAKNMVKRTLGTA